MTIQGSLQASIPIVKAFFSRFLVQNLAESVTPYLNSLTPTCLFTTQRSPGYEDDKG